MEEGGGEEGRLGSGTPLERNTLPVRENTEIASSGPPSAKKIPGFFSTEKSPQYQKIPALGYLFALVSPV